VPWVRRLAGRCLRNARIAVATYSRTASGQRAAAISYHVLFSLVPFVALLVSALDLLLPETTERRAIEWLLGALSLPGDVGESVEDAVERTSPPATLAGAIAIVGLLWAASGMMASVRSAFRAIWASDADRPYLRGKLLDLALVLGAGILVVSAFGLTVIVQLVTETSTELATRLGGAGAATSALGSLAQLAGSLALALVAFLLLYRVVPPVAPRLRDVVPGAIVATIGFQLASAGFSIYLRHFADFDEVYGPLGAVLAFLVLVYLIAMVLLFGACVAAAWPESAVEPPTQMPEEPLRRKLVRALRGLVVRSP
jgi:membrane protein